MRINMDLKLFNDYAKKAVDWTVDYREKISKFPVRAQVEPKEIFNMLPDLPPEMAENIDDIFQDMNDVILPGITHWQHPRFFAYFPSNAALPAVLAEYFINALGAQALLWQTSPAATELEEKMMVWLREALGLPTCFFGTMQESASSATLSAILTMREIALNWQGNQMGLSNLPKLRIYTNKYAHSSIEKDAGIAGIGRENVVKIPVRGDYYGMDEDTLRLMITEDLQAGYQPVGIIACIGGTSVGSCDDLEKIAAIAQEFKLYLHVDAAWAGSAMICPEFRHLWQGIEQADSIMFNPYKWLGTISDGTVHFMKEPEKTIKTLAISPEYLKTLHVNNFYNHSDFSMQLGRRFRALKVWFLLRIYGLKYLRGIIRNHVEWAQYLEKKISQTDNFEIYTSAILSLFTFRYVPDGCDNLDEVNLQLVQRINDDGTIYLTHTEYNDEIVIRFQAGTHDCQKEDIDIAYDTIVRIAKQIKI